MLHSTNRTTFNQGTMAVSSMSTKGARVSSKQQVASAAPVRCPVVVVARASSSAPSTSSRSSFAGQSVARISLSSARRGARSAAQLVYAVKDGAVLDRKLRVAVIGGGPSGACAAESLAKVGIETYLIERKMDNCKVSSNARRSGCMGWFGIHRTRSLQPMRSVGSG